MTLTSLLKFSYTHVSNWFFFIIFYSKIFYKLPELLHKGTGQQIWHCHKNAKISQGHHLKQLDPKSSKLLIKSNVLSFPIFVNAVRRWRTIQGDRSKYLGRSRQPEPHTKFNGHQLIGSGKEDFHGFYDIWAWKPFGHITLSPWRLDINLGYSWPSAFKRYIRNCQNMSPR